ncbi:uncharacterized protein UTRI_00946_B [Ustilago trichophora]|uniref:SHSP domain-containing protein n=1 Tax=Ustilago trichophora TaxID=86804 RepID=A0A5C3DSQ7_9BASI|nr:uncharacterized protein UTRI_00946_B [Ustilago trichophora]
MPKSISSHDSHQSIPDSLPSLDDHNSVRSTASISHSSLSSHSAYWANPPDTLSSSLSSSKDINTNTTTMYATSQHIHQRASSSSTSAPQRSSTIKASNHAVAAASGPSSSRSSSATIEPSIVTPSDASPSASTSSQPVLHSLVFPSNARYASGKSAESSNRKLNDAYLALDEAAPRLSMSSTGSGSTSELATPENVHQSWPYDDVDGGSATALAALQSSASSSAHALNEKQARSQAFTAEVDLRPPSRELDAASSSLDRLAIQRPAKLERLSSAATNTTAKGSTRSDESPQTATQSPRGFHAPDLSSLRISSGLDSCASAASASSSQIARSPSLETDMPDRANMTSPDSWRSLLPEHDPYFASEGQLRASQHQRSASPQSLHPSSGAFDIEAYVAAKTSPRAPANDRMSTSSFDTARTSFSSAISGYSSMSMVGPSKPSLQSQDSARSDSWRSLLPDDDRYHASRETSGAAARGLEASPCLASPSLSDHLDSPVSFDGHNHRSAFFALQGPRLVGAPTSPSDLDSAARRHASFSSVEPNNSTQYAATRHMLASMRDATRSFGSSTSASDSYMASASGAPRGGLLSPRGNDSLDAPSMTPALSHSTADDSSERDSWPTSRGGRASSPASSGPMTPETGHTPHSKSSLAAVLGQEPRGVARVDSPAHVSETSDSVVKATHDGLLATTTTTTTKTTTTTTTQLLSDASTKARSEAGVDGGFFYSDQDEGDGPQSQPMKTRTSSCSVSTPISPPSLPFLERRPAPPETDLVIETERTRYTLITRLPGFSLDCITLATKQHKHHRTLHIVADKWDTEGGGHFERRITFPDKECDLKNVKAEFDGNTLKVYVPRKCAASRFSSASSATF